MKRRHLFVLLFSMICITAILLAGCKKEEHEHSFGEWKVTKEAGCETQGEETRTCECGEKESRTIEAKGHAYGSFIEEKEGDCTNEGEIGHYHCSACGKNFDSDKKEVRSIKSGSKNHKYGAYINEIPATCKRDGIKGHYHCSACNKDYDKNGNEIEETIIKASHSYGDFIEAKNSTCKEEGNIGHYHCEKCDGYFDAEKKEIEYKDVFSPTVDHTYGTFIDEVPATATENGTAGHYHCSVCGKNFDSEKNEIASILIPATEHSFGEWNEEVPADCNNDGVKGHYHCSHCNKNFDAEGKEIENLAIPKSHKYGKFIEEKSSTCEKEGVKGHYHCDECDKDFDADKNLIEDLTIEKKNHTYGEWNEGKAATCTENGARGYYHCSSCGKNYNEKDEKIGNTVIYASHDYGDLKKGENATCEKEGTLSHYECSVCHKLLDVAGNEIKDTKIAKKEHSFSKWNDEIPATCTEYGTKGYKYCSLCRKNYDKDGKEIRSLLINPLGHNYDKEKGYVPKREATCTENGWLGNYHCSRCNKFFDNMENEIYGDVIIKATGHDCNYYSENEATCTKDGNREYYYCNNCEKKLDGSGKEAKVLSDEYVIISAGHIYGDFIEAKNSTCKEEGNIGHYHCEKCDGYFDAEKKEIEYKDVFSPTVDHTYGTFIDEVPATATENGTAGHYHCSVCGKNFDSEKNEIASILIPATEHSFGEWNEEVPADCNNDGVKGHYHCSHCNKNFDAEGKEIENLTIPKYHECGELIPARNGDCQNCEIKIAYRECKKCFAKIDENGNKLEEDAVFGDYGAHTYDRYEKDDEYYHIAKCSVCGYENEEPHDEKYEYGTKNGVKFYRTVCRKCGLTGEDKEYLAAVGFRLIRSYIAGKDNLYSYDVEVIFEDGSTQELSIRDLLEQKDIENIQKFSDELTGSQGEKILRIELNYMDYSCYERLKIESYRFIGFYPESPVFQQGKISSLNEIYYYIESNYRSGIRSLFRIDGIIDDGGFDPDFDFEAAGVTEKRYTIKASYNGEEYTTEIVLVPERTISFIRVWEDTVEGKEPEVMFVYTDEKTVKGKFSDLTVTGEFDYTRAGTYTFKVKHGYAEDTVTVTVHAADEIESIYLPYETKIGEKPYVNIHYYSGAIENIEFTPDMVIYGKFDPDVAGRYNFTVKYNGVTTNASISVYDPSDYSVEKISLISSGSHFLWSSEKGKPKPLIENVYISAYLRNKTTEIVKVTEDMLVYDQSAAEYAINNGERLGVYIYYKGAKAYMNVSFGDPMTEKVKDIRVYNTADGYEPGDMYICDGEFLNYILEAETDKGRYFVKPDASMLRIRNHDGTTTEFTETQRGRYDRICLAYNGCYSSTRSIYLFSSENIIYNLYFYGMEKQYATVGSPENVIKTIKNLTFYYNISVEYSEDGSTSSYGGETVDGKDVNIFVDESADFTSYGTVMVTVNYKNASCVLYVNLIPDLDKLTGIEYTFDNSFKVTVYDNGYLIANGSVSEYKIIDTVNNIVRIDSGSYYYMYCKMDAEKHTLTQFNPVTPGEEYTEYMKFDAEEGEIVYFRVYCINGVYYAAVYEESGGEYVYSTVLPVSYDSTGIIMNVEGTNYLIGDDNMLTMFEEGLPVYTMTDYEEGAKVSFNDNGKAYFFMMMGYDENGDEIFMLIMAYDWEEADGKVNILYRGMVALTLTFDENGNLQFPD